MGAGAPGAAAAAGVPVVAASTASFMATSAWPTLTVSCKSSARARFVALVMAPMPRNPPRNPVPKAPPRGTDQTASLMDCLMRACSTVSFGSINRPLATMPSKGVPLTTSLKLSLRVLSVGFWA